jgi:Ricin-type beta-trefoil lectin domain
VHIIRNRMNLLWLTAASVAVLLCGLSVLAGPTASAFAASLPNGAQGTDSDPAPAASSLPQMSSNQIIANAWDWYISNGNPPYSESNYWVSRTDYWGDGNGDNPGPGWREDCSGFVSHAWGYDDSDGGFTTYDVMDFATDISWSALEPGDALLLNGVTIGGVTYNHIGLFMGWDNSAHTEYSVMDETDSSTGTVYQQDIPLGSDGFWQYAQPIQYDNYVLSSPLTNRATGKCMSNGGSTANSAPITQYTCNGSINQEFYSSEDTIVSAQSSDCFSDGGSTANSAPITQYPCNGSPNQGWHIVQGSGGYFTIQNAGGFCMTTGGSTANSAPVTQYACNGSENQEWSD